jgi:hypothetical protein
MSELESGTVYFIRSGARGPIKIGFTRDLNARLKRLQSASAQPLKLLTSFPGELYDEMELHGLFREHRLHNEWFKPHPDILQHIQFWEKRAKERTRKPLSNPTPERG